MIPLRMASIAGFNGPRGSLFHGSATNVFGQSTPSLGTPTLGQSQGLNIYTDAKKQVARFDTLVERTRRLANQAVRDEIIHDYGLTDPGDKDKAQYARDAVAYDISRAESFTPPNYYIYEASGPAKNRPGRLREWNSSFNDAVEAAERTYGILPQPVVIERVVTVPGDAATSPLIPVVLVGALGIAALAIFDVI